MMIRSYMDESLDMRQFGVFAVGGILGRDLAIFELERRWEHLMQQRHQTRSALNPVPPTFEPFLSSTLFVHSDSLLLR